MVSQIFKITISYQFGLWQAFSKKGWWCPVRQRSLFTESSFTIFFVDSIFGRTFSNSSSTSHTLVNSFLEKLWFPNANDGWRRRQAAFANPTTRFWQDASAESQLHSHKVRFWWNLVGRSTDTIYKMWENSPPSSPAAHTDWSIWGLFWSLGDWKHDYRRNVQIFICGPSYQILRGAGFPPISQPIYYASSLMMEVVVGYNESPHEVFKWNFLMKTGYRRI